MVAMMRDGLNRFRAAVAVVVLACLVAPAPGGAATDPYTVLITGSNRGIGLALARQFAGEGWRVIATCRHPGRATALQALAAANPSVVIEQLDVTDHGRIEELAQQYRDTPIDVLLNNAGISGGMANESFGALNYAMFDKIMAVNAIAPVQMAEAFMDSVAASRQKKIMTISSGEGSVASIHGGRLYFYRSSKRALNMMMHTLARQVADRGIIVGLVGPGAVDTDMMKGIPIPKLKPADSARDVYAVIAGFSPETSGSFIHHDGKAIPW